MSIEPITIPMSIEVNDVTIDSTIETNEVTIESTFDAKIEVVEGGDITVQSLTVTENGTTTAPTGKAYSPVIVNVPASAVDTGTKSISTNGTHDVVGYASAAVSVPNTYTASDEGKVVDSGALVSQTSTTVTTNGTYDTTTNDEVVVNVSGGTPTLITKTITENGTYSAEDDDADGYSEVTVNVSGGVSNFEAGEITIASSTNTVVVPVSNLYTHFCICRSQLKSSWTYASGRNVVSACGTSTDYTTIDTNNAGGNSYIGDHQPDWRGDKIEFTPTQISCKVMGNGAIANFPAGAKYVWIAWNEV